MENLMGFILFVSVLVNVILIMFVVVMTHDYAFLKGQKLGLENILKILKDETNPPKN